MAMGAGLIRRQASLLRSAPHFRLLFLAAFGSGIGTMLAVIALTVDVYDRTESGGWVAALLVADFLPTIVIGLLLGPVVDRFSRKRLMIGADVVRLAAFVALPFAGGAGTIVALAAVVGLANGFFRPASYAGMPNLVEEADLPHANSLFQAADNSTWLLGPLIGGVLLAAWGPDVPYLINAATFLFSALLIARIPIERLRTEAAPTRGHWRDLAEGFAVVRRSRAVLTVAVAWTVVMFGNAWLNVGVVFLVREALDAGNAALGLMMGGAGLGLFLGSALAGTWIERAPIAVVYGSALTLMAAGFGVAAVAPAVWLALPCVVVGGFGNGLALVCNPLLVQQGAPDHVRGRVFTVVMSLNFAFMGLGMAVAGPLTDSVGPRWVWGGAAMLFLVAAALGAALARGVTTRRPREREQLLGAAAAAAVVETERVEQAL